MIGFIKILYGSNKIDYLLFNEMILIIYYCKIHNSLQQIIKVLFYYIIILPIITLLN